MTELGAYVERFETNCRRRALRGVAAIVIGTPIAVLGVVVFVLGQEAGVSGGEMVIGLVIGCGLGLALMGVWGCWHAIGKRGEIFTLYEQGFVHIKAFGGDVGCLVELTDGRKILINGFTEGAALLAHNIFEAVGWRPG